MFRDNFSIVIIPAERQCLTSNREARFHCLLMEPYSDHYNSDGRQHAHSTIADLPTHQERILEIEKRMLCNKLRSVQNTWT